ncbi:NUDIX hydrolase, partial [Alphaproteobacteria bacterium]|nr:NUDIX hydrolase [Alphaproteobacteria bacterium]
MKGNTSGVGILPIINNKIGLIEIFRPAIQEICWEIAHGFIEKNETNEEAAIRELKEETGIESNKKDLISLGLVSPDSGVIGSKMNLFAVEIGKKNLFELDEFGIKDFKFFSFKDVERMIKNSKIHDSYTIASVYKYKVLKKLS